MKHRLCLPALAAVAEPGTGTAVTLSSEQAHYLGRVLRLKPGEEVGLFDGRGREWGARLVSISSREASAEIVCLTRSEPAPEPLVLVQAWLKGSAMDTVVQKAVELGVTGIRLLSADRSNVKLDERRLANKIAHLNRVARSAVEQCESLWLPELSCVNGLRTLLDTPADSRVLFLDPGAPPLSAGSNPAPITLVVGPEGGWSEAERRLALADPAVTAAGLGDLTLRAETAPLAALAAIRQDWGWRR
ncbi:MAG: 16S rRNA (uracil(1498)-N(3))-methyltransferase [Pseudomonadales bacterium]